MCIIRWRHQLCKKAKTESYIIIALKLHVFVQTEFSVAVASGKESLS